MHPVPLNPGAHYAVRYTPPGARVPREFVAMYLGPGRQGEALWSLRPEAGTASTEWPTMISVQPTLESVRLPRKVAPHAR